MAGVGAVSSVSIREGSKRPIRSVKLSAKRPSGSAAMSLGELSDPLFEAIQPVRALL